VRKAACDWIGSQLRFGSFGLCLPAVFEKARPTISDRQTSCSRQTQMETLRSHSLDGVRWSVGWVSCKAMKESMRVTCVSARVESELRMQQ
jgi:hypothetical protein